MTGAGGEATGGGEGEGGAWTHRDALCPCGAGREPLPWAMRSLARLPLKWQTSALPRGGIITLKGKTSPLPCGWLSPKRSKREGESGRRRQP